ncbi:MAG: Beta-galactosidase [Anaerocolumna sp.]|jgi:beta-galactosidase|nr:Beta-galactosidase [Anaerocolumna sp.]
MIESRFDIKDDFYLNDEKIKIISGGMHYFRIVKEYWRDRLVKLKNLGCNTVETYIPWNMHEPHKGTYCFEGMLDIKEYIELAQEIGLWVIVRPSPYICAEWEFGGLPAWLLAEDGMRLRGSYEPFLNHVRDYYKELFKILSPLQINYGGPIIMMQIENEYGYYGNDTNYLEILKDIMIQNGTVVPMITSDGPWGDALNCGSVPGVLPTANFGSKAKEQFEILEKHTSGGPLMCMEFWIGWFDYWGSDKHQTSDLSDNVKNLSDILQVGNVNIYMFHGGTNFGFMNGSNYYDKLTPDVTSYDYDSLLTEGGKITPKYEAFKKIIKEYNNSPELEYTSQVIDMNYGDLKVKEKVSLSETINDLTEGINSTYPKSMEKLGQNYGYILYRSYLTKEKKIEKIRLWDASDRAQIFINDKLITTLYDLELLNEVSLGIDLAENSKIDILVENMGRVNFGPKLEKQRKGIDGGVQINDHGHLNWEHFTLSLDNITNVDFSKGYTEGTPAFYLFEFDCERQGDTYLDFSGWGKGCAFINGFNLGRFWEIGPQKRLYIPGPLIKVGKNTIILFETEGKVTDTISLIDQPCIG